MPYYRAQGHVSLTASGQLCARNNPLAVTDFCDSGHVPPTRFITLMADFEDFFVEIPEAAAHGYYQSKIKNSGPQNLSENANGKDKK